MWFTIALSCGELLSLEGQDLAPLTKALQEYYAKVTTEQLHALRKYMGTITLEAQQNRQRQLSGASGDKNNEGDDLVVLDNKEAHEFAKAVTAFQCKTMEIQNFLQFPLPILQMLLLEGGGDLVLWLTDDSDQTITTSSSSADSGGGGAAPAPATRRLLLPSSSSSSCSPDWCWKPFYGSLQIRTSLDSIHWGNFYMWLQETSFCHAESCLRRLTIDVAAAAGSSEQQHYILDHYMQEQYDKSLERLLSIPTKYLTFHVPDHRCSSHMLKSLEQTHYHHHHRHRGQQLMDEIDAKFVNNTHIWAYSYEKTNHLFLLSINDGTHWRVLSEWLDAMVNRFFPNRFWDRVKVDIQGYLCSPSSDPDRKDLDKLPNILSSLRFGTLDIDVPQDRCSWLVSEIIVGATSSSHASHLDKLVIGAKDDSWIIDDIQQALTRHDVALQELHINFWENSQPDSCMKKFESLLQHCPSISSLQLGGNGINRAMVEEKGLPVKMQLRLNQNGKQKLLRKGKEHVTPTEWVWMLTSTNDDGQSKVTVLSETPFGFNNNGSSSNKNDDREARTLTLSCLYYFVRNNPIVYATLASASTGSNYRGKKNRD